MKYLYTTISIRLIVLKICFIMTAVSLHAGTCTPPSSGDWTVTESCIINGTCIAPGNVWVTNNSVITIPADGLLDMNLKKYSLHVDDGSGVKILVDTGEKLLYDFVSDNQGWTSGNNTVLSNSSGIMTVDVIGSDPWIYSPSGLDINADNTELVKLSLKNTTNSQYFQMFWITSDDTTWGENKFVWLTIDTSMTAFSTYTIDLSNKPEWQGTITQIRIDPVNSATSGNIDFELIGYYAKYPEFGGKISQITEEMFGDTNIANGYRAHSGFCTQYSEPGWRMGDCLEYRDISPDTINIIPCGEPSGTCNDADKYWEFTLGPHKNVYINETVYDFTEYYDFISDAIQHVNEGWSGGNNISLSQADGILSAEVTGSNSYFNSWNMLDIDASQTDTIQFKLKNPTSDDTLKLYWIHGHWQPWDETKSAELTIDTNMSDFAEYVLDLSAHPEWNGFITQLRVDPVQSATSGIIDFDYIKIISSYNNNEENSGWTNGNNTILGNADGITAVHVLGTDPYIFSPENLDLNAKLSKKIQLILKNTTNDSELLVSWITASDPSWDSNKSQLISIDTNMSDFAEYIVDMSAHSEWIGTIKQLRIDPVQTASSGIVYFDLIRLYTEYLEELLEHRMDVDPLVVENTPTSLIVSNYNNFGLEPSDSLYNTRLATQASSNKAGTVRLYHNGLNIIRNSALYYGADYKNDVWPHLIFSQKFKNGIDLANYKKLMVSMDVTLLKASQLTTWPNQELKPHAPSATTISSGFFLKGKEPDMPPMYFLLSLYDTSNNYQELLMLEQHGVGFYRIGSEEYGGILELNETKTIQFDLKKLIARAIEFARTTPGLPAHPALSPDNYIVYGGGGTGLEDLGHWETEQELSNLSITAYTSIPYNKSWHFFNDVDGWQNPQNCTLNNYHTAGYSALEIDITGANPYFYSEDMTGSAGIDANNNKLVRMKINNLAAENETKMKLYWVTDVDPVWNEDKSREFDIYGSDFNSLEYLIHLENHELWKDTVTQLRIHPASDGSLSEGIMRFDYIAVSD